MGSQLTESVRWLAVLSAPPGPTLLAPHVHGPAGSSGVHLGRLTGSGFMMKPSLTFAINNLRLTAGDDITKAQIFRPHSKTRHLVRRTKPNR
jgi:hypothetical protein